MERIEGYVDHIIYRNQDNGYTVMNVIADGEEITCVGLLHYIGDGELVEITGHYKDHATYGRQLQIETLEIKAPEDELSIERYLGSGAVKGIGVSLAARIVRKFHACLILRTYGMSRCFWSDHSNINICWWNNTSKMNVETMCEH